MCGGMLPHAGKVTVFGDARKVYSFYNKVVSEAIFAEPLKVYFDVK